MSKGLDLSRPEAFEGLWKGLLSAFPSQDGLEVFVKTKLGFSLERVAVGNQNNRALDLVEFMRANGRAAELLRKALEVCGRNPELLQFERKYLPTLFSRDARRRFVSLVSKAAFPSMILMDAAVRSLPSGIDARALPADPAGSEDDLWRLIEEVEGLQGSNGLARGHLLLEMAFRLLHRAENAADKAALRQWCRTREAEMRLPATTLAGIERHVLADEAIPPFLLVKLLGREDCFTMQVWLGWKKDHRPTQLHADDEGQSVAKLQETLDDILVRSEVIHAMLAAHSERLDIEFILACDEIEHPVECWSVTKAGEAQSLHLLHDVVVRPLERVYAAVQANREFGTALAPWENRWKSFARLAGASLTESVLWLHQPGEYTNKEFTKKLTKAKHVCLGVATVPSTGHPPASTAVRKGLAYGIPVAAWLRRCDGPHENVDAELKQILATREEMRERVRDARECADGAKDHWGEHMVLLWDNWDHRPPDAIESDAGEFDFAAPAALD